MTLLALPALWWANQDDDTGAPTVASVGVDVGDGAADPNEDAAGSDDVAAVDEPVFLDGPSTGNGGAADIAVPAAPSSEPITGLATYSSIISNVDKCFAKGITTGTRITVVNLDNNRSIDCVATFAPAIQRDDLVMHTRAYLELADLTDAPIPVEMRQ